MRKGLKEDFAIEAAIVAAVLAGDPALNRGSSMGLDVGLMRPALVVNA